MKQAEFHHKLYSVGLTKLPNQSLLTETLYLIHGQSSLSLMWVEKTALVRQGGNC